MENKSRPFSYYFVWILIGLVTGFIILTLQGHIQLTIFGQNIGNGTTNGSQPTGFSHAVSQASSSVVSIQAARYIPSEHAIGGPAATRTLSRTKIHLTHPNIKPAPPQVRV